MHPHKPLHVPVPPCAVLRVGQKLQDASVDKLSAGIVKHAFVAALVQVSKERQLPFDKLPVPAPGLKTSDPNTKHLLSLASAACTPYNSDKLRSLGADVRYGVMTTHAAWHTTTAALLP